MQFAPLLILKLFAKNHFRANAIQKNSENFQRMYRFFQRIFISSKEGLIVQKHLIYKKFFLSKRVTCDLKTMSFFRKNKEGLAGRFKIVGQVSIGIIVGVTLYFHEDVVIREFQDSVTIEEGIVDTPSFQDVKSMKTTIPFLKNNELNYSLKHFFQFII